MKKMNVYFFILCSGFILACGACKKDNNKSVSGDTPVVKASFIIDGGGFANQTVEIIGTGKEGSYCTYFKGGKLTSIYLAGKSGSSKNTLTIFYNDNTIGTEHGGDDTHDGAFVPSVDFELQVVAKDGKPYNFHFTNADNTPETITVTKYGAPGATVEGNFEGTLTDADGNPGVHITAGKFAITRGIDQD